MKNVLLGMMLMALLGCLTADRFIASDAEPQKGERIQLYFRTLKVVQIVDDCVHVMHETNQGLRICVVPLVNDYVTGSYLRTGLYEYMGPYTYETIKDMAGNKGTNTVRLFKEVDETYHSR